MASLQDPVPDDVDTSCARSDGMIPLMLSLSWSKDTIVEKKDTILTKRIQTWLNKKERPIDFAVLTLTNDGKAVIAVPPEGLPDFKQLPGETLTSKGGKLLGDVTILSISRLSSELAKDLKSASTSPPTSLTELREPPSEPLSEPLEPIIIPDSLYMYVLNKHREELDRILAVNGVKMITEMHVLFEAKEKNGNPTKAKSEYTDLVQRSLGDSISRNNRDIHVWPNNINNSEESPPTSLVALTAGNQEVFSRSSVNSLQSTSSSDSHLEITEVSVEFKMTIKDDLLQDGLTLDEESWKQMNSSEQLEMIKSKFKVDFESSVTDDGTHIVKASYNKGGRNASMESHAIRALLRLHQKIATSPLINAPLGTKDNPTSRMLDQASAAAAAPLSPENGHRSVTPEMSEDICVICHDSFTDKTTLVCKHSFCKVCLQTATEFSGAICPLCRNVFGVVTGNQPDGTMKDSRSPISLPGFPDCGTIVITYHFPSGTQTEKHPEPGRRYHGTFRQAYLPDNKEGNEIFHLLERAFKQKLIFTIGSSRTTGAENQVTWNDIHHKTRMDGGPLSYGYPDPLYLNRVREELKAKGIE